jgi:hypothetical protein
MKTHREKVKNININTKEKFYDDIAILMPKK